MFTAVPEHYKKSNANFTIDLFEGFMLSSVSKLFFFPIIIWRDNLNSVSSAVHLFLVITYFILTLTYVHSVIVQSSRKSSGLLILMAFLVNKYLFRLLHLNAKLY